MALEEKGTLQKQQQREREKKQQPTMRPNDKMEEFVRVSVYVRV